MDNKLKFETIRPLIDEAFENGQAFTFKPNGVSMLPFIKGSRTVVTIEKYKGGAKKNDIVFYVRSDGKYVMHRIVKIYSDSFGVCGDNQWWVEKVYEKDIFAIATEIEGKKNNGSFIYLHTLGLRRFLIHVEVYIKKHFGGKRK